MPKPTLNHIKHVIDKYALLWSGVYSFVLFLVVYTFAYPCWEASDDFMISGILAGIHGTASPYVLVIGYPLSCVLCWLQTTVSGLNWLTVLELFSVWVTFTVYIWIFLRKKNSYGYLMAAVLPAILESFFYVTLNYTRSAALLSFTGLFLMYYCCFQISSKLGTGIGGMLFLLGSLVRYSCCFLVIPYVGIWIVTSYWKERKRTLLHLRNPFCVSIIIVFLTVFSFHAFHEAAYEKFNEKSGYVDFNNIRARACDYLPADYESYEKQFEKIAITRNDYEMMRYSMTNDSFYNADIYELITGLNMKRTATLEEKYVNFRESMWKSMVYYNTGRNIRHLNMCVFFFFAVFLSLIFVNASSAFPFFCTFVGTMIITSYFIWTGRFPSWVQDSIYLIGIVSLLYGVDWEHAWIRTKRNSYDSTASKISVRCVYAGLMISCLMISANHLEDATKRIEPDISICQALNYMEQNECHVYLIDNFDYCPFPIMNAYGTLRGMKKDSWKNIMRVGT